MLNDCGLNTKLKNKTWDMKEKWMDWKEEDQEFVVGSVSEILKKQLGNLKRDNAWGGRNKNSFQESKSMEISFRINWLWFLLFYHIFHFFGLLFIVPFLYFAEEHFFPQMGIVWWLFRLCFMHVCIQKTCRIPGC